MWDGSLRAGWCFAYPTILLAQDRVQGEWATDVSSRLSVRSPFTDYDDAGSSSQERSEGWSSSPHSLSKRSPRYEHGGYEPQPSGLQEEDGNVMMMDVQEDPKGRE